MGILFCERSSTMTTSRISSIRRTNSTYLLKDIVRQLFLILRASLNTSIDTETGPGVYETALAYTTALRMADNAILFKFAVKSLGMKYGITPSFMAKPWGNVSVPFVISIL